jgi:hypothetical protein
VKQPKLPASFSLLILLGLSLGISVLAYGWRSSALAQSGGPSPYYAPPPISGNVYQNQAATSGQPEGPENVMIILDSSYSMSEPIGGKGGENKMVAAKRAVLDVVRSLDSRTRVGLRIYGNSSSTFGACKATNVLVPIGDNNRNLIASKMIGIRPTGATPISYTVERSLREDFGNAPGKKSIILISDGMETCGEDPCDVAVRMQQLGANIKINVVGFGLHDYAATKQLRCVALATKGKYYSANTAVDLVNSLNSALAAETRVQGTILIPSAPPATIQNTQPGPTLQASPAPARKIYEEKLLPADLPKKTKSR